MSKEKKPGLNSQQQISVREKAKKYYKKLFNSGYIPEKIEEAMAEVFADQVIDSMNKIPRIEAIYDGYERTSSTVEQKASDFEAMLRKYTQQDSTLVSSIQATFNSPFNIFIGKVNEFLEKFGISLPFAGLGKIKKQPIEITEADITALSQAGGIPQNTTSSQALSTAVTSPQTSYQPVQVATNDHGSMRDLYEKGSKEKPATMEINAFNTFSDDPNPFASAGNTGSKANASQTPVQDNPWVNTDSIPPMKANAPLPPMDEVVAYDAGADRDVSRLVPAPLELSNPWAEKESKAPDSRSVRRPSQEEVRMQQKNQKDDEDIDPWSERTKKEPSKDGSLSRGSKD